MLGSLYRIPCVLVALALFSGSSVQAKTVALSQFAGLTWQEERLAPGVQLRQQHFTNLLGGAQFISIVSVELNQSSSKIGFAAAHQFGKKEMIVPELGERSGALLAVNGGFFDETTNANCGILKIDGKLMPFSKEQPEELWFVGGSAMGFDIQGKWHFMVRTNSLWPADWSAVNNALAGGHHLIIDGSINPHVELAQYDPRREQRHAGGPNPRTAFGITTNKVALIVALDGRHPGRAEGITLKQLAHFMKQLGCENSINLDGGGSTTLWVRGRGIINYPCDNKKFDHEGARLVRTAVIITTKENQ